jgi:hypothetical protein
MLYAQINPTAKTTKQVGPFQTEIIEADYMAVLARPYAAGSVSTNFETVFGTVTKDAQNNITGFQRISSSNVTMTDTELATWGTDDSVLLTLVATKIGTTASNFVTLADSHI